MVSPTTNGTMPTSTMAMAMAEAPELSTSRNGLSSVKDCDISAASVEEKRMASQLAYLASQHHTSEYSKIKFGPNGAPLAYIPLSIQLPAHVWELRSKQIHNTRKRTWWPAEPAPNAESCHKMDLDMIQNHAEECSLDPPQQENVMPCTQVSRTPEPVVDEITMDISKPVPPLNHSPTLNLRRELSMAMSSPLSIITIPQLSPRDTRQQPNLNTHAKTSESHPINISSIIPYDLLPLISSHLIPTPQHSAYMFDLPPSLFLNHLAMHASTLPLETARFYPMIPPLIEGSWSPPNCARPFTQASAFTSTWQGSSPDGVSEQSTMMGQELDSSNNIHSSNKGFEDTSRPRDTLAALLPCTTNLVGLQNDPLSLPNTLRRSHSTPPSFVSALAASPEALTDILTDPSPTIELAHAMSSDILGKDVNTGNKENAEIVPHVYPPVTWAHNKSSPLIPFSPTLGNMLLSSCPGKKVRLNGPIKGRGAICRDLGHDLKRIKSLGVGCIICCLDDEELEFLGAPWPQYLAVAQQVGLDILRVPTPEGLGPINPAQLDENLSHIIHSYTLEGVPVLVHCRGGVGRAGLIACCWMLKLGLCGWLPSPVVYANGRAHRGRDEDRKETIQLVERVVTVVRRRRSVKAIETYEQVRFLVEFVEHLRKGSRGV